jgi:NADH:ubiquinone oxidoreductase subunit 6 (subunit J)
MTLADLFVALCIVVGALGAFFTAFHPNILYAAISLIFSLLAVAGLYGALGADFLAGVQLIIYVGGIIIVILFAVMMSENIYRARFLESARKYIVPVTTAGLVLFGLSRLLTQAPWGELAKPDQKPTSNAMGWALVGPYALPFQYVAIVLLAGLIGAVVVARPHHEKKKDPS